jgi:hypothetical protein
VPHLFNSIYLMCYKKRQIIPRRCSKTADEYGKTWHKSIKGGKDRY